MLTRILIVSFILAIWPIQMALADCSTLAARFANNPDSLNVDELADLSKCVSDKL